jgi:ribosomal protein S18 acetylase RimI-like enzyme
MITLTETKDHQLLAGMNEQVQSWHHSMYPHIFRPYAQADIALFFESVLKEENATAFVAQENGQPLGYTLFFIRHSAENAFQYPSKSIHIDQILVLESNRKKGIGQLMMDKVCEIAKAKDIELIDLNHWAANDTARRFFTKNGFSCYNERMSKKVN